MLMAGDHRRMTREVAEFESEAEEFEFWSKADSTEYLDWSRAERVELPKLVRTPRTPREDA